MSHSSQIAVKIVDNPLPIVQVQFSPRTHEDIQHRQSVMLPIDPGVLPNPLQPSVSLASFKRDTALAARSRFVQALWILIGSTLLAHRAIPFSGWRIHLLRMCGAQIGRGVKLKTGLRVRFPWKLKIGDNCWIGEECWMDNWAEVEVGNDVCISQNVYLCTGNHDWTDVSFAMNAKKITIQSGAWVASRSVIAPGVTIGWNSIASIGSVVVRNIPDGEIHNGNPATFHSHRVICEKPSHRI